MYVFVIDVSHGSVNSGILESTVASVSRVRTSFDVVRYFIRLPHGGWYFQALDQLPGDDRTQVGFVTFDSGVHFYNLKSTLRAPQMMVR